MFLALDVPGCNPLYNEAAYVDPLPLCHKNVVLQFECSGRGTLLNDVVLSA